MKKAANFLKHVYNSSIQDVANIVTAEAENDRETIIEYLNAVKEFTEGLIEIVKNNEST